MVKLISINIEWDKHHDTTIPFLKIEKPDILCLQEVFEHELYMYEEATGLKAFFKPACYFPTFASSGKESRLFGSAILTKDKAEFYHRYIIGTDEDTPIFALTDDPYRERNKTNVVLVWANIHTEEGDFKIATTHFTWTPEGLSTNYQIEDIQNLIKVLDGQIGDFILVGDLNSPRGRESFSMLAEKYKDNIPPEYDSSIDPKIHRVRDIKYMVDGLFSTKEYQVSDVRLVEGISDHKGVVANISKNS